MQRGARGLAREGQGVRLKIEFDLVVVQYVVRVRLRDLHAAYPHFGLAVFYNDGRCFLRRFRRRDRRDHFRVRKGPPAGFLRQR